MKRDEAAEIAIQFHGAIMNGGAVHAIELSDVRLSVVRKAYAELGIAEGVRLAQQAERLLGHVSPEVARQKVNQISEAAGELLEQLGDEYTEQVTDTVLAEASMPRRPVKRPRLPQPVPAMANELFEVLEQRRQEWRLGRIAAGNRLADRSREIAGHLRATAEGRAALWALRDRWSGPIDRDYGPRDSILIWCLDFEPAAGVLLATPNTLTRKYALIEWRAGRLRLPEVGA